MASRGSDPTGGGPKLWDSREKEMAKEAEERMKAKEAHRLTRPDIVRSGSSERTLWRRATISVVPQHNRSHTMPQSQRNPNFSQSSEGELPHVYEGLDSFHESIRTTAAHSYDERSERKRTSLPSMRRVTFTKRGSAYISLRPSLNLGINRNLLVDLDKIEKTAGKVKARRRNSISTGELYEARELHLEGSRNGVIHPSLMHHEWRRKRFQGLYQAMKRRKMLMRLQTQALVPKEVHQEREMDNHVMRPRSSSPTMGSPFGSGRVIMLEKQVEGVNKVNSEIYLLNDIQPQVLLAAPKLKLATKTEVKETSSESNEKQEKENEGGNSAATTYGGSGIVFLTRHGEREDHVNPKWYLNAPNVFDPPLSNKGFKQASELGIRLKNENITHIIASPFTRTIQTAVEVAKHLGLKIHIDMGLAEHMETKQFQVTCARLQLDPRTFQVTVPTHQELLKRFPKFISPDVNLPEIKLNKWPARFPEDEEELFERTNNTVKHMGLFGFEHKANVLLVSHQTPVEYMAFELCSEAEDKFVSVCCLTKAAPRKNNPKKKGWKLLFQHDDSFLSEPECTRGS
mmetsp:Transcript_19582/g.47832  ORF Transcript_19582/g.47832 Transcript_19582/m.47832 type:complete len:571 (+) Transcript_19582:157-1869(+)